MSGVSTIEDIVEREARVVYPVRRGSAERISDRLQRRVAPACNNYERDHHEQHLERQRHAESEEAEAEAEGVENGGRERSRETQRGSRETHGAE